MLTQKQTECIDACNECITACLQCAASCLQESEPKAMVRCIALDLECADIFRLAAASIARSGEYTKAICALCEQICNACGVECSQHPVEHCQKCSDACRRCADACLAMTH